MQPRRLICSSILLAGLFSGCAGFERRPERGAPAAPTERSAAESERADLLRELSLYSD
jgi:hypothetical protein